MTSKSKATVETGTARGGDTVGYLSVLLATACWGTSAVFIKLILATGGVSALALAFWRDLTTFLVLLVGLRLLRPDLLRVPRRDLKWLVALGGSLAALHVIWNLSVSLNGAAVATAQQAATPVIVATFAWLVWREPLTRRKILAIILTFAGTLLLSGVDAWGQADFSLAGFLVGLALPVMYAVWNLLGKRVRRHYGPFTMLTYSFGVGALALLPLQFFTPRPWPVPASVLMWFAGLIAVATVVGFSIYTYALGRLQAGIATILAMAEIPIVAVYAYALLGERLTADQILGGASVFAGVLALSWRSGLSKIPSRAFLAPSSWRRRRVWPTRS